MTPEREAQLREMFQEWWATQFYSDDEREAQLEAFLACARALEPFAVDAFDLGWLSCVEWSGRDDLAADMQSSAYLSLRNIRLKALAEKPNAV